MHPAADTSPDHVPEAHPRAEHIQRVHRVLRHIHANLGDALDLATLGKLAHLSPPYLNCVFRGIVGESLYQHVKRLRLERAAHFLRLTKESVKAISLACGFETHEAFTRAFTAAFGFSPREFRRRHSLPIQLPAPTDLHYRPDGLPAEFRPAPDEGSCLEVRIVELPAQRLACARYQGPYTEAHRAWPRLLWWAWRRGRLRAGATFHGLTYDDERITPDELQRYDAAIVVEDSFRGDDDITALTVEAGLFARTTVIGSFADYWRVSDAFIYQWLPVSGYAIRALYTMDRYHVPEHLLNPFKMLDDVRKRFHVDLHLPIMPGPIGRSLLA